LIEDFPTGLDGPSKIAASFSHESHQDFSVIIIDVPSSAGKAQLFGKMLLMMMAVLEDIHLWTCVWL